MEYDMKRNFVRFFIACALLFCLNFSAQAAETLTLDPQHTYVLWHIKHFGFSTQVGKWYASGTIVLDENNPQNSKVDVTIQVANMITGIAELDQHLKGNLFFDVVQYPIATFISNKVIVSGKTTAKVYGELIVHGISKPVILDVNLNQTGKSPITDKMTVGFSATTKLKRSDFGISTLLPGLADEVKIDIEAEAYKPN